MTNSAWLLQIETLTTRRLVSLCRAIGVIPGTRKSDTKSRLMEALFPSSYHEQPLALAHLARTKQSTNPVACRVLSIDMGFYNMAYSLVTLPDLFTKSGARKRKPPIVQVHEWNVVSLTGDRHVFSAGPWSKPPISQDTKLGYTGDALPVGSSRCTTTADNAVKMLPKPNHELFISELARLASIFLHNTLLPLNPTHVLIERQRFHNLSTTPEWRVRINLIEGMLHGIFMHMRLIGAWNGEVLSINPMSMSSLFSRSELELEASRMGDGGKLSREDPDRIILDRRMSSKTLKSSKILAVERWLRAEPHCLRFTSAKARHMKHLFLERIDNKGKRRKKATPKAAVKKRRDKNKQEDPPEELAPLLKLDDLADSMVQAIGWLTWQFNYKTMLTEGVAGFLDESNSSLQVMLPDRRLYI